MMAIVATTSMLRAMSLVLARPGWLTTCRGQSAIPSVAAMEMPAICYHSVLPIHVIGLVLRLGGCCTEPGRLLGSLINTPKSAFWSMAFFHQRKTRNASSRRDGRGGHGEGRPIEGRDPWHARILLWAALAVNSDPPLAVVCRDSGWCSSCLCSGTTGHDCSGQRLVCWRVDW